MAKLKYKQKFETPVGELQYVMVWGAGKFEYGALEEQRNDPTKYEYQAGLNLDFSEQAKQKLMVEYKGDEAAVNAILEKRKELYTKLQADIDAFWTKVREKFGKAVKAKPAWQPLKLRKDPDTDEPIPNTWSFNTKTAANWRDKKTGQIRPQIIPIYDFRGNKIRKNLIEKNLFIGNGSKGIIFCTLTLMSDGNATTPKYGITAYLSGIQIAKFVPYVAGEIEKDRLRNLEEEGEEINFDALEVTQGEAGSEEHYTEPEAPAEEPEV